MEGPTADRQLDAVDALTQLSFLIQRTLERSASEQRLSITQTRLLAVLRDCRPTMNELAQLLELDKSSITGLVDRAERRNLVARVRSGTDRRTVCVELTDQGQALASLVERRFQADVAGLLDGLMPAERSALAALASGVLVAHAAAQGIALMP